MASGAATRLTDIPADHGVAKTPALPVWLDGLAARHGNQTALKSGETSLSFEGLSERARSIAAGMLQHGIGPGDRVAVWMVNDPDWLAVFLACTRVGVIVVAVNTRFRVTELADMLERTQPRAIFYRAGLGSVNFSELIRASIARVNGPSVMEIVAGPAGPDVLAGALPLEDLLVRSGLPEFPDPALDDGAIMFATSGTTSAPKFVLHSHRSIVDHAVDVSSDFFMTDPDSTVLQALPYCGVFGFCQAMAALAAGRPSIIMDIFDPVGAGRLIADERVTHFNATDEMLSAIVEVSSPEMRASLRLIGAASFNRGPETLATLAADHGLPIVGLYGMSEVQALYARRDLHDPPASRFHGGGRPVSRVAEIRVRDPESGELLAAGKSGELELRGPSLLKTYFGDVAATGTAMTEDGFVRTGDLGFLEEDGSFTFESRMGDALRLGGFLVNPDEISGFIETIEGIVACVVVGVRAEGRQRAAAFVKTREPAVIDPQSVIDRCKGGLAPFKIPVIVHALQEFPVADGPNGVKIQRGELRRLAIALTEQ